MRIRVDKDQCMGNGICVQMAPDFFVLDEDGRAEITGDEPATQKIQEMLKEVANQCPSNAIEIED